MCMICTKRRHRSEGTTWKPSTERGDHPETAKEDDFQIDLESRKGTPTIASAAIEPKAMQTASPEKASKRMLSSLGRRAWEEGVSQKGTKAKQTYSQHSGTGTVPQLQGLIPMAQIRQINRSGENSGFKARNGNISSRLHNSGKPPSIQVRSGKPFVWLAESTFLERCRRRRRPQVPAGGGCKQDNMHTEIYRTIVYGISLRP